MYFVLRVVEYDRQEVTPALGDAHWSTGLKRDSAVPAAHVSNGDLRP